MPKKVNIYYILFLFAVSVFFKPNFFSYSEISLVNSLYLNVLRLVFLVCIIVYFFLKNRLSKFVMLLLIFYFTKFISTFINNGSISTLITEAYPAIGICILIELGLEKKPKQLIEAFATILSILTLVNFITMIIKPHGYSDIEKFSYFLRNANQLAPFYILTIVMIVLRNSYNPTINNKIQLAIAFIICTFMIFYIRSGSNIIAWIPMAIYFIIPFFDQNSKIFNIISYLLSYIILFVAVIVYNIQVRYAYLLKRLLGKDVTLSGRVELWNTAIVMIKNKPLFGYGMADSSNIIYSSRSGKYLSAHNQFVQLMVEGGLISMLVFGCTVYLPFKKLYQFKKYEAARILSVGIFAIALVLFSEAMSFFDIFILFAFAFNINKVVNITH